MLPGERMFVLWNFKAACAVANPNADITTAEFCFQSACPADNKHLWFGKETTCRQATCSAVDLRRKFRNDVSKFQATFTAVNDVLLGLAYLVRSYFGKNEQSDRTNLNRVYRSI